MSKETRLFAMNGDALSLIILLLLAGAGAGAIVFLSALIGRTRAPRERLINYECGLNPACADKRRVPIKFFLTAMLFIIFEAELLLLFPWAVAFRKAVAFGEGAALVIELVFFLALIGLALLFAFGSKALKWEE